jgi:FixJ family two-component response regulator
MPPLIAIIDDDVGIRDALRTLMRSASYQVETFASAEAFVASGVGTSPDCIITDVAMQGMSGLELVGLLRSRSCTVPVILISALTDDDLELRAKCSGARCLLHKPIEPGVLISLVEESLSSRKTAIHIAPAHHCH